MTTLIILAQCTNYQLHVFKFKHESRFLFIQFLNLFTLFPLQRVCLKYRELITHVLRGFNRQQKCFKKGVIVQEREKLVSLTKTPTQKLIYSTPFKTVFYIHPTLYSCFMYCQFCMFALRYTLAKYSNFSSSFQIFRLLISKPRG